LSLDAASRRRYARQILLAEIGERGQERLLESRFRRTPGSDEGAFAIAAEYLGRAGCSLDESGEALRVPDESAVRGFAGSPALEAPAAAVIGAFCAVEHLKAALGMKAPREFPVDLTLCEED
jgi:hypothetical protein